MVEAADRKGDQDCSESGYLRGMEQKELEGGSHRNQCNGEGSAVARSLC